MHRFSTLLLFLRELQIGCLRLGISCSLSSILWGLGLSRGMEHSCTPRNTKDQVKEYHSRASSREEGLKNEAPWPSTVELGLLVTSWQVEQGLNQKAVLGDGGSLRGIC